MLLLVNINFFTHICYI